MFKKDAFCNVASNNRTNKQSAVFIYKTNDDITTVTATDYFLDKIVDLQLHDIIIHEHTNSLTQTDVSYNMLVVSSRTLTSVGTTVIATEIEENLVQRMTTVENTLPTKADSSTVSALTSRVTTIEGKIPTQASSSNQLADKNFVNSSIATETAHYISDNGNPFTSVAALEAYTGTVTNNDYAFVTGTDSAGNTYYDRYKATVSGSTVTWAKEYRLNNSSFTSNQWTAINSGITPTLVTKINEAVPSNTNCLTAIPQDINLTLSNGLLTLKSGSKVYVPNGSGVFNTVTVASDHSVSAGTQSDGQYFIYTGEGADNLGIMSTSKVTSGTTAPTTTWCIWYDTTNNRVKKYEGTAGTVAYYCAFMLGIVTVSGGAITSIDQVFNGLGYMGSTVFALPGVKGLIPNGRNSDGSLKNTEFTVSSVLTRTYPGWNNTGYDIFLYGSGIGTLHSTYEYDEHTNYNMDGSTTYSECYVGKADILTSGISNFNPKPCFHAADYYDLTSQLTSTVDTLLATLYPVGSLYIGTQTTCPMPTLISGSTWTLVSSGKALWTGDGTNANTTIDAGLPNITGSVQAFADGTQDTSGSALYKTSTTDDTAISGANAQLRRNIRIDASRCSTIYGNSTTVQPPAYVVNVWRRTA